MKERKINVTKTWPRIARLDDDYIRDVDDPQAIIQEIKRRKLKADIFTFWQRVPDSEPHFPYYYEWEEQAILHIQSYDDWFHNKANRKARQAVTRAVRRGLVVKEVPYDDNFISGITKVINETPIRQGRPYAYYGMTRDEVDAEFRQDLDKCVLLGCFFEDDIIGFVKLGIEGEAAVPFGMISMNKYLDKCPQNLLLSESVKVCIERGIPFFWYGQWHEGGLGKFKIYNGFSKLAVPRYYVPVSLSGKLAIMLHLHRGLRGIVPEKIKNRLRDFRKYFYKIRSQ